MLKIATIGILLLSSLAHADNKKKGKHEGACADLRKACEAAGKTDKAAWKCVQTIKNGGTVEGVTATASDACKAAKRWKNEKK